MEMKKSNTETAKKKPFSSRAFKRGSLSLIFVAVAVVAVILLNVVVTALSNRYPFSLDLTAGKDYTIELEKEHEDFIKSIATDIEITVCAAEGDFSDGGNFAYSMVNTLQLADNYYGTVQEVTNKYARQTALFIKTFAAMNDRIKVEFRDANSVTDFAAVKSQYPNETLSYGDIIVSCSHTAENGEAYNRYRIIKISDIFATQADSTLSNYTYYPYRITGSTLATEITSALYIVTSEDSIQVAVLGGHGASTTSEENSQMAGLKSLLVKNNYTFTDIGNLLTDKIPEEADTAVIFRPTADYTADEIAVLSNYLKNDGNYGKNLVYVPSTAQPALPNLEEFLTEWGIQMLPAIAYEDTQGSYYYTYNYILAEAADSPYTEGFDASETFFYPSAYRLAKAAFTENGNRYTTKILVTPDTTVGMPIDASADWTKAMAEYTGPFDLVLMGSDYGYTNDTEKTEESHVLMVSGDLFFEDQVLTSAGSYNATLTLNLFNGLAGVDNEATAVEITEKTISSDSFSDVLINSYAPDIMYIVFVLVIPVGLIVAGFVIWRRRRKRV